MFNSKESCLYYLGEASYEKIYFVTLRRRPYKKEGLQNTKQFCEEYFRKFGINKFQPV